MTLFFITSEPVLHGKTDKIVLRIKRQTEFNIYTIKIQCKNAYYLSSTTKVAHTRKLRVLRPLRSIRTNEVDLASFACEDSG